MRSFLLFSVVAVLGCGHVIEQRNAGAACQTGGDCSSGVCADQVCCDRACDGACEACVASKTGAADGTCAAVTAGTDPDAECTDQGAASCGANGTGCNGNASAPACNHYAAGTTCASMCTASGATVGTCDANATCVTQSTSCGYYACSGAACRTTCGDNSDCDVTGFCNASHVCLKRLRIALETGAGSCTLTQALPVVKAALEARGHTVTLVSGIDIDTAAELANYDVVVTGALAACANDDRSTYDAAIGPWVMAGGGLVGTGWVLYVAPPANFAALMPNSGTAYLSGAANMTPVGNHPIVAGLGAFVSQAAYTPYGGSPKSGATQLLRDDANNQMAQAWDQGSGRVVFVAPLFIDDYTNYANQALTNGTIPNAKEFFLRSIEWAGKGL